MHREDISAQLKTAYQYMQGDGMQHAYANELLVGRHNVRPLAAHT